MDKVIKNETSQWSLIDDLFAAIEKQRNEILRNEAYTEA
jgi:hypothetical protein